jgi:cytoskeletal protein CcmA (bactofilin family)
MSYYHIIDYDQFLIEDKVQNNAQSALNYCISLDEEIPMPKTIDLYETGDDSVSVKSRWWGCYKSIAVKAFKKNYSIQYNCLVGASLPKDTCLISPGKGRPLSVSGRSEFKGICLLSKSGIKTAYVDGQNYIGNGSVVKGLIKEIFELPEPDKAFQQRAENLLYNYSPIADSLISMDDFFQRDSISNSFLNKTLFLHSDGVILLSNKVLTGNILIHSSRKIIVDKSCVINNILVVAPKIEISEKFSGTLQAFASDTLKTGKDVTLYYPSSLVVYSKDTKPGEKKQPALFIDENNLIKGQLVMINASTGIDKYSYLRLSKESVLEGSLYTNGYLDLQATVKGLIMAQSFLLVTPSSVYENHVLNAIVDRSALSDHFSAGMIFNAKRRKSIAKWVN